MTKTRYVFLMYHNGSLDYIHDKRYPRKAMPAQCGQGFCFLTHVSALIKDSELGKFHLSYQSDNARPTKDAVFCLFCKSDKMRSEVASLANQICTAQLESCCQICLMYPRKIKSVTFRLTYQSDDVGSVALPPDIHCACAVGLTSLIRSRKTSELTGRFHMTTIANQNVFML